jgi:hypothetical protein
MQIIDADAHVIEGGELMQSLLTDFPDQFRFAREGEVGALYFEGRPYPNPVGPGAGCPPAEGMSVDRGANPFTPEGVLADADREHIDTMVFFPNAMLGLPGFTDQRFAAECARRYNRWLAGYCRPHGGRLRGVGLVPIEDVETSTAIVGEIKQLGLVAVMIPACLKTRNLDHPDLERFFRACEAADLPVCIHGAPGIHLPKLGSERFDNYLQVHCVSFPFDMMVAMTALVMGGVLERHPALRVGFLESGVGWVPYFLDRMDEHFEKRGRLVPAVKRAPSEYVARGQIFVSCEPEESALPLAVERVGATHILYASDYPHWDGDYPESTKPLRERTDISDAARQQIFETSARTFYRI